MFAQVFQGRTSDPEALRAALNRWVAELGPTAIGWLGSTDGTTDDGTFIAVARFESADAAARNSGRPEQGEWWAETEKLFDGDVTFRDSEDVEVDLQGDPDTAGFVQIMQGRVRDVARARELMARLSSEEAAAARPDVLGSVWIGHDGGEWTQVVYFASEAEAREGERTELPPGMRAAMEELMELGDGPPSFYDLRRPGIHSPA
ncbi:hypothetical protein [Blastococcus sp. PRF04-17]|uniref:hypothetical protein n=1 Tax=Blastococcus sp. PRF04-17 TaxID=2933797 RepID=UPI001FF5A4B6|nr:hypothetical protein [Blastococcus sp. PRF04-17]UOY02409.1 hypothetical protein MVA48_03200 [Blastococcus sp. PRF04-17]